MKTILTLIVCGCLTAVWLTMPDDEAQADDNQARSAPPKQTKQQEPTELATFMRKKLRASNQVLEGLVMDNPELVTQGAEQMLTMSRAEGWRASNDMMYLQHSREFRRSVEVMRSKAEKRSIDGAALAWMDVTLNCIQCHEWVRDTIIADSHVSVEPFDDLPVALSALTKTQDTQ